MPLPLQAKLLKYLDSHEIRRVGGTRSIKVECAIIAATNKALLGLVSEKVFRKDLYYRLNSFILQIPPLRERREDIAGLTRFYLGEANRTYSCAKTIGPRAIRCLQDYQFPGNVRELRNILENAVVMSNDEQTTEFILDSLTSASVKEYRDGGAFSFESKGDLVAKLQTYERELLVDAKKRCRTTREVAQLIGISQPSVIRKFKQYKIG